MFRQEMVKMWGAPINCWYLPRSQASVYHDCSCRLLKYESVGFLCTTILHCLAFCVLNLTRKQALLTFQFVYSPFCHFRNRTVQLAAMATEVRGPEIVKLGKQSIVSIRYTTIFSILHSFTQGHIFKAFPPIFLKGEKKSYLCDKMKN